VLAAKVAEWAALTLIPVLTAIRLQFARPAKPEDLFDFFVKAVHARYAAAVGILAVAGLIGRIAQEVLGAERKTRIKAVVDTLEETLFRDVPADERYHNRATLFRASWRETKLKAYCRSGTIYQRRRPELAIHDSDGGAACRRSLTHLGLAIRPLHGVGRRHRRRLESSSAASPRPAAARVRPPL
jgi:hypothetical protein